MSTTMLRAIEGEGLKLRGDGRTVEGMVVPYNVVIDVVEPHKATGQLIGYKEKFLPRSCMAMAQAISRRGDGAFMSLLMDHEDESWDAKIGFASELRDEKDGAHGVFRLYESRDLEKVQSMLRESHNGLSIAFHDTRPPKIIDDVVARVQVHIGHVAATPTPAYSNAGITAMRDAAPELVLAGTPKLDDVSEWLAQEAKRYAT